MLPCRCTQRLEKGTGFPGARAIGSWEPSDIGSGNNSEPLKEQYVLVTLSQLSSPQFYVYISIFETRYNYIPIACLILYLTQPSTHGNPASVSQVIGDADSYVATLGQVFFNIQDLKGKHTKEMENKRTVLHFQISSSFLCRQGWP